MDPAGPLDDGDLTAAVSAGAHSRTTRAAVARRSAVGPDGYSPRAQRFRFLAAAVALGGLIVLAAFWERNAARFTLAAELPLHRHPGPVAGPVPTINDSVRAFFPDGGGTGISRTFDAALHSRDRDSWENFCRDVLPGLVREDPRTVAEVALRMPAGYEREEALRLLGQGWGSRDGFAAMDWAADLNDTDDRASAMANVSIAMSQSDPAAALVASRQYGVADNGGLYENMVALWAARDAAGAFNWVDALPASPERDAMMERVAFAASKTSPADAAILATVEIADGALREDAVLAVLHQWGLRDIAAASSWVVQFPQGALRERAEAELQALESSNR
jgi:hypothetical protein